MDKSTTKNFRLSNNPISPPDVKDPCAVSIRSFQVSPQLVRSLILKSTVLPAEGEGDNLAIMQVIIEERNLDGHQLAQNEVRERISPFSSSSEVTI